MLVPIGLLALGAVLAGQLFHDIFVDAERAPEFWRGSVAFSEHLAHAAHEVPLWVKLTPTIVMLIGLWIAWNNYIRDPRRAGALRRDSSRRCYRFVLNKWYFDELYDLIFVRPALWLGRLFWKGGDEGTIDRFGPHGAAYAVGVGNRITARLQSGYLYSYALVMLLGLIGAASWAIWWARSDRTALAHHPDRASRWSRACCACSSARTARAGSRSIATLIDLALGAYLWAAYDPDGAQWQFVENVAARRRRSTGRSASTASRWC